MSRIFASAVDRWFVAVIVLTAILVAVSILPVLPVVPPLVGLASLAVGGLAIGLPVWILRTTRYIVDGGQLTIRSGPFSWQIPIADITTVRRTRSPLASPALSLDRLEITRRGGTKIMISPRDRRAFLDAIGHEAPP